MNEKKILIIDDNISTVTLSEEELKKAYSVNTVKFLEDAIYKIETQINEFHLIILDVMMPPDIYEPEDVDEGLTTGYRFYQDYLIHLKIPIIVWSRNFELLNDRVTYPWNNNVKAIIQKNDREPFALKNKVDEILNF